MLYVGVSLGCMPQLGRYLQVNSPRWRLWWVRGMLLTYHYRHKCSGSTFRVAGAAASVAVLLLQLAV